MNRKNALLLFFLVLIGLFLIWTQASLRAAGHGTLKVTLSYTGAGTVDQHHQLYVLLADFNPFTSSKLADATSHPNSPTPEAGVAHILACEGTATRQGTVNFRDVAVSPVYAVAFFDKNGTYNGHLDSLPSGSPMGVYGKMPNHLEAIKIEGGRSTQIVLTFDDSTATP